MFTKISGVRPTIDTGPGLTKQSMRDDTNINFIMAKYHKTGLMNFVSTQAPTYMEVQPIDFQQALNAVNSANEMFAQMPATLRKKFDNDPGIFMDFVHNPENADQFAELGLALPKQPPEKPSNGETEVTPSPDTPKTS